MYLRDDIKEHILSAMFSDKAKQKVADVSLSQHIFDQMMALKGQCFRHQEGRATQRITLGTKNYFIKQHVGIGWKEIFKNIAQLRWPVLSAKNEWLAIQKLQSLGVAVPTVVAYGKRGSHPAWIRSFIMMEELAPMMSLEELCHTWQTSPPSFVLKQSLVEKVAHIARMLHQNGLNHRDFYLCHFLLDTSTETSFVTDHEKKMKNYFCTSSKEVKGHLPHLKLYLIDLHRAQIRHLTPRRWTIKDLAGLYFSCKDIGLTQRDLYRFMKNYAGKSLREIMDTDNGFWLKVKRRGEKLYRDLTP